MDEDFKIVFGGLNKKIDKLDTRLDAVNIILAKQSVILAEHVKRSTQLENRMVPIEKHIERINGGIRLVGMTSILVTLIAGILKIFRIL